MSEHAIRLLVADDSPLFVEAISERIAVEPNMQLVGVARDGQQAHELADKLRPDVITMDVHMPALNGFEAVARIMSNTPTPILVLTADPNSQDSGWCFEALSRGALELMAKPDLDQMWSAPGKALCERIRLLAQVSVVHHAAPKRVLPTLNQQLPTRGQVNTGVVVVGSSTGGPNTLSQVLGQLPREFSLPIVIVQHLADGFVQHLANWLEDCSELRVEAAREGSRLKPGKVFLAPDKRHLAFETRDKLVLRQELEPVHYCPSADVLFRSAAECYGSDAIGVILTGMGRDGAEGLKELRSKGALTIAQSPESCAVDGMPRAAREVGAVVECLPPSKMGPALMERARYILSRHASRQGA